MCSSQLFIRNGEKTNLKDFKSFYNDISDSYKDEVSSLIKTMKRQVTSYLRESTQERFHSIFNKLFILQKYLDKGEFYDIMIKEMNNEEKVELMSYILGEGFGFESSYVESKSVWEHQLNRVLERHNR